MFIQIIDQTQMNLSMLVKGKIIDGTPLVWKFYVDYLEEHNNNNNNIA